MYVGGVAGKQLQEKQTRSAIKVLDHPEREQHCIDVQ